MNSKPRPWLRSLMLFVAFLAFVAGAYLLFGKGLSPNNLKVSESMSLREEAPLSGLPIHISIPSVGINAPVIQVGLTEGGAMEAPEGPVDTGWYNLGPRPGETGSAVIAGHRGFRSGPAVFDNLHKVNIGDHIVVTDDQGIEYVFAVRDIETYGYRDKIPEVWNKNDAPHLNLITCSGAWSRTTGTSEERLVVFTDMIEKRNPREPLPS